MHRVPIGMVPEVSEIILDFDLTAVAMSRESHAGRRELFPVYHRKSRLFLEKFVKD